MLVSRKAAAGRLLQGALLAFAAAGLDVAALLATIAKRILALLRRRGRLDDNPQELAIVLPSQRFTPIMEALRSSFARVVALLAALILGAEASGVARAMEDENVRCCCGLHQRDRACACPDCPVGHHDRASSSAPTIGSCHGGSPSAAHASLPAFDPPRLPSLVAPRSSAAFALSSPVAPADHLPPAPRPPP